jgi:hypothetical protein
MDFILFKTKFWSSRYVVEECKTPDLKLLYAYVLFNDRINQIGIYSISEVTICFETRLPPEKVKTGLSKFEKDKKIMRENGYIWVINALEHHPNTNPKVMEKIAREVAEHTIGIKAPGIMKEFLKHYSDILEKIPNIIKKGKEEKRIKIDKEEDEKLKNREAAADTRPKKVDIKDTPEYIEIKKKEVKCEITHEQAKEAIEKLKEKFK